MKNVVFGLQTTFFYSFNVLLSFLAENDAERFRNFVNKSVLDPKRAKLNQQFYGIITEILRKVYGTSKT